MFQSRKITKKRIMAWFHELYYNSRERTWFNTFWLGTLSQKCPLDLWIYQEIIYELKPDIIIECGTANGGTALFLASICDLVNKGKVITIDIKKIKNRPTHRRITYLIGSSTSWKIVARIKKLIKTHEKVIVILDSDHNKEYVLKEMRIYSKFVTRKSYLIVEDTNINGHPVEIASNYGIDIMVYMFYWNRGRREMSEPLDSAFLKAKNRNKIKFSLMWCWKTPRRNSPVKFGENFLYDEERIVKTDLIDFKKLLRYCFKKYFLKDNYWKINNKPVLFVYTIEGFIKTIGEEKFSIILKEGNQKMKKLGFDGLYVFGMIWDDAYVAKAAEIGLNVLTPYVFLPDFHGKPIQIYDNLIKRRLKDWREINKKSSVPFYPSISPGWDGSPRGVFLKDAIKYKRSLYPWTPIIIHNNPNKFRLFAKAALGFSSYKYLIIASWNEWTEGHYIEPDQKFGYKYLEQILSLKQKTKR